ncbi:MAG: lamin tail domain-containing protein [Planctomycetes bacterium]|nr:lamin tail domain-containing protein [Planctomycetota bacterium]
MLIRFNCILMGWWIAITGACRPASATDLAPGQDLIISEISYNPPGSLGSDDLYEFVEIHHRGVLPRDLSGWRLKDPDNRQSFAMPPGTPLGPGGFLVLARSAEALKTAYGLDGGVLGDVPFNWGNGGDTVRLFDAQGALIDQVIFSDELPWPAEADGGGATLERVSASSDLTDFTNFAASLPSARPGTPGKPNFRAGSIPERHNVVINEIMYNPVVQPGADPLRHCSAEEFMELYNRGAAAVDLSDWRFLRGPDFTFPAGARLEPGAYLVLYRDQNGFESKYGKLDSALGPYAPELEDGGGKILLADAGGSPVDFVDYNDAPPWPVNPDGLQGSLELLDPGLDNDRAQAWRESASFDGTPGRKNSATAQMEEKGLTPGPQITAVRARPAGDLTRREIRSTDAVRVEAKVLDRQGVAAVTLEVQVAAPGGYIRKTDARYQSDWKAIPMTYDPEETVYTALLPALPHRTLVRYRVSAVDGASPAAASRAPYPGDPEPNFAYFVQDGVPDYVAGERSRFGEPGFTHKHLDKIPVYFMIGAPEDIEEAQYHRYPDNDKTYRWLVTFVHEGHVYDHCAMRLRSSHRYSWPKRPWKIRFNRGNYFQGRFVDGAPYPRKRHKVRLLTAQHDPGKPRGESGVFESLAWKLYQDAGVMAAATTFVHLRVIGSPEEGGQFDGDFFGIYLEVQGFDATTLEDLGRPTDDRASLYKFSGEPLKRHPDCDLSRDDVLKFVADTNRLQTREWWEEHLDVPRYLSFRAVTELTDNHDMDSNKNYYYYFNTGTGRWEVFPWDLDNTFGATASGDEPLRSRVLPLFSIEYKNRFRFLWQVLYDEKRLFRTIDEWSGIIREVADADLDRWDTEPREACPGWPVVAGGNCKQYLPFTFRMKNMKAWIRSRAAIVKSQFQDPKIPQAPVNRFPLDGAPAGMPVVLRASPFVDPDPDDRHAATRWLLIERGGDWAYPLWDKTTASEIVEAAAPDDQLAVGKEYLFRAAYQDSTGRFSLLSEPTSFFAGPPDATPPSAPGSLTASHLGWRSVALRWESGRDPESGIFGYRVRRDGEMLTSAVIAGTAATDFQPRPGRRHVYQVIAVNRAGFESAPSPPLEVEVPEGGLGGWRLPDGGWDYLYDARPGEDRFDPNRGTANAANLDGAWARSSKDDWEGSRPGTIGAVPDGLPGGAGIDLLDGQAEDGGPASVLAIEDPGDPTASTPPPNNRRIYFLHDAGEGNPLEDGVTLIARLRVHPRPLDLPGPKGQSPEAAAWQGQIGIVHRGNDGRWNFSLWLDGGRLYTLEDRSVPADLMEFQEVWTTIAREGDQHRVRLYLGGAAVPAIDALIALPSVGTEPAFGGNYLQMGLANTEDSGALQIDYFGFKRGAHPPGPAGGEEKAFRRGDADGSGRLNIADAILMLNVLFRGKGPLSCPDAADADDSGWIALDDALHALRYLFLGGPPPPPPFPGCGTDPTLDSLPPGAPAPCS